MEIFLKITYIPINLFYIGQKVYTISETYDEVSIGEIYDVSDDISISWMFGANNGFSKWTPNCCGNTYVKVGKCKKLKQLLTKLHWRAGNSFKINWKSYPKEIVIDFFGINK